MATPAPEIAPDRLAQIQAIAEAAPQDQEAFKEQVKTLTEQELNTLSEIFLNQQKDKLSDAVRAEIRSRLEALDTATVNENLETLLTRIPAVQEVLKPKANADRLREDMDRVQEGVASNITSAYDYVKTNVLTPLVERTKDTFLIGPLLGSLTELSPTDIGRAISRKWYQFLGSADILAGSDSTGFFGKMLSNVADGAKQKLTFLDIRDVIDEHLKEKRPGESITMDERLSKEQWRKIKEMAQKDPTAIPSKVSSIIDQRRVAGITTIKITCADLLKTDTEAADQAKTERLAQMKAKVLSVEAWKNAGVTSVAFSPDETSLGNGVLTIVDTDLDDTGAAKPSSRAAALLEAKKVLSKAEKIVISKDPKDMVSVNWNTPKTVTIPVQTAVEKGKLNDLVASAQPDRFSTLEIGPSDSIARDEVQLVSRNGSNVLLAENNPDVLTAIASGQPEIDTAEASPKYKYAGGSFTLMPTPVPIRPA